MAGIVYEGVRNATGDSGKLFGGQSFWFSSAVPQRKWLIENAIANGATVVPLEKQADVLIVDHARKNAPVGTHSYKYIEQSIRNGRLERLADHVVGLSKSTDRPVGSMTTAAKGSRHPFTEAEDQLLWDIVKPFELGGGSTAGNEIYKQLEEAHGNGRHTYQSWRDRWLKHVRYQNRKIIGVLYTAEDGEEEEEVKGGGTASIKPVSEALPRRQVEVFVEIPALSPSRAVGESSWQARVAGQRRQIAASAKPIGAATVSAREALQRKLGINLPNVPGSLNARPWERVSGSQTHHVIAGTKVVERQYKRARLDTRPPVVKNPLVEKSEAPSQLDAKTVGEEIHTQSSQASVEDFTEDEYKLLLDAAGHIIRVGDQDNDSWEQLAEHYPSHSATSWREFWEEKVKPDYQKQILHHKKEQSSREEAASSKVDSQQAFVEEAEEQSIEGSSGDAEFQPSEESPEDADDEVESDMEEEEDGDAVTEKAQVEDEVESSMEEGEVGDVVEKAQLRDEENSLDSLLDTPQSSSAPEASPFACRWLGCDADISNLNMLVEHIARGHKPSPKQLADGEGWTCRWTGCRKVRLDDYGNECCVDLQSRQLWVNHYLDEHILPINSKHGPGTSLTEVQKARHGSRKGQKKALKGEDHPDVHEYRVDPISSQQNMEAAQVNGAVDVAGHREDAIHISSEDGEETNAMSSLPRPSADTLALSSNEDDSRQVISTSTRRRNRFRKLAQQQYIKDSGFNYIDKGVGSSPPLPAQDTPAKDTNIASLQPLSPSASKAPEPNEARKRSASKGNSQESAESTSNRQEAVDVHGEGSVQLPVILPPRKRSREPESEPGPGPEHTLQESLQLSARMSLDPRIKRRKQRRDRDNPLEIPSSPEYRSVLRDLTQYDDEDEEADDDEGSSISHGSPTPRLHPIIGPSDDSTPGILAQGDNDKADGIDHSSPLQISLFGDPDHKITSSSPSKSTSPRPEELSSDPDMNFGSTAQTTADMWGTAPSEELDQEDTEEEEQWETAPEPKGKERARLDTQSLFARDVAGFDGDEDPFALPEPEGGWPEDDMDGDGDGDGDDVLGGPLQELSLPPSHQRERLTEMDEDDDDDDDAASIASDVPDWIANRTSKDNSLDVEILLRAIQATSGCNEKLIIDVHDFLLSKRLRKEAERPPVYMKGCWTAEDDAALNGGDRRERLRILKKHGREAVERRIRWLNEEI